MTTNKTNTRKRSLLMALFLVCCAFCMAGEPYSLSTVWAKGSRKQLCFFWISDSGRNGFYQQKKVGEKMG